MAFARGVIVAFVAAAFPMIIMLCLLSLSACQAAKPPQPSWEDSLTPDQRVRLEAARLQALGLALSGGPIFRAPSTTRYAPPADSGIYCYSNDIGASRYTNCY